MAGWEEELASLLKELGVKQEESPSPSRGDATLNSTNATSRPKRRYISRPMRRNGRHDESEERRGEYREPFRAALPDTYFKKKETSTHSTHSEQDDDPWSNDVDAMRREIDSIVKQVIRQMQSGNLAPALKDDVMIVLRALHRRAATQQAATSDEAYIESAAALLHFCRLVLQLNEQDIRDF